MDAIIEKIRNELRLEADEKTRLSSKRFFKETVECYGVPSSAVNRISKLNFVLVKHEDKNRIIELCTQLWQSGMLEETFIACHWSNAIQSRYEPDDFGIFTHWIENYVHNWASCDTLCNHTVGDFILMYPSFIENLKQLAHSNNRWMKRASAVSLIIPARKGYFLTEVIEIATHLLLDADDMVQKGYGWMLKAASQAHETEIFDFVMRNKAVMPRTSLRYAIEKMPANLKKEAMAK